jgi:hypothetical protein
MRRNLPSQHCERVWDQRPFDRQRVRGEGSSHDEILAGLLVDGFVVRTGDDRVCRLERINMLSLSEAKQQRNSPNLNSGWPVLSVSLPLCSSTAHALSSPAALTAANFAAGGRILTHTNTLSFPLVDLSALIDRAPSPALMPDMSKVASL